MLITVLAGTNVRAQPKIDLGNVRFVSGKDFEIEAELDSTLWLTFTIWKVDGPIPGAPPYYQRQATPAKCYVHRSRVVIEPPVAQPYRPVDAALVELIAKWESYRGNPYNDPAGNCTGGFGNLIHLGKCDDCEAEQEWKDIPLAEAKKRLVDKIDEYAHAVDKAVKVPITDNQWRALVSFCYNVGIGGLNNSIVLRELNAGHYDEVPGALMRYVYGTDGNQYPGLVNRRRDEGALWRTP